MKNKKVILLLGVGTEVVAFVFVGIWVGYFLDSKFNWQGWGVPLMIVLSFLIWVIHVVFLLKD